MHEGLIYYPQREFQRESDRNAHIVTADDLFFGTPKDLTDQRAFLSEMRRSGEIIDTADIREMFPVAVLQNMLIQREGDDLTRFSQMFERAIGDVLDKPFRVAERSDIAALIRSGEIPPAILAQYANMQYHQGQTEWATRLAPMIISGTNEDGVIQANMYNLLATLSDARGDRRWANEMNQRGLQILDDEQKSDNVLWQKLKIEHGLALGNASELQRILEQRILLGDSAHIGRTHLDIARALKQDGDRDGAVFHYRMGYEQMVDVGYLAKAADAQRELEALIAKRSDTFFVGHVEKETVIRFEGMKIPASCLVKVGDQYLVRYDAKQEVYAPITVDQERAKDAEKTVRSAIARILNRLHPVLNPQAIRQMKEPVTLSQRGTKIIPNGDKFDILADGRKHWFYTISVSQVAHEVYTLLAECTLDNMKELGYVLVSSDDLAQMGTVDDDLERLITNELQFLAQMKEE